MFNSLARVCVVAGAQIRICRSLVRFWIAVALLTLVVLISYIQASVWQMLNASYSPSFSLAEPKYLLANLDALVIVAFQFIAVLLAYDVRPYHGKNRIQAVIETRHVTNFEYLFGSVIGVSILLYLVVLGNVALLEGIGAISFFTNSPWGDFLEPISVFNLLIFDAFPNIFLWSSIALGLTCILRSSTVAVLCAVGLLVTCYVGSMLVPFSWLEVVSPSSNVAAYISELVPDFATREVLTMRLATIVGALGLLVFAAYMIDRRDAKLRFVNVPLGLGTMAISVAGFLFLAHEHIASYAQPNIWSKLHSEYDQSVKLDVEEIRGSVHIDPGQMLAVEFTYRFRLQQEQSAPHLTFTLNPGLSVDHISLNDQEVKHDFSNGLLIVHTEQRLLASEVHDIYFQASGIPDPRFAYLDSPVDYFNDRSVPLRATQLFGEDGSIFSTDYVALLPGTYWYPVPGAQDLTRSFHNETDFFLTDLSISVSKPDWLLVSTDIAQDENTSTVFKLKPEESLSEIALFGTNFVKQSMTIAGINFNLYLHPNHLKNVGKFNFDDERVREAIDEIFLPFKDAGLGYPFKELSFVEVPNRLRTLSGGFKTESVQVLPGMFLLKERGFPLAHFDTRIKRIERWEEDPENWEFRKYRALRGYYGDGVGTDNLWASFPKIFWLHSTSASGENAVVLNDLIVNIISQLSPTPNLWFSPYATYQISGFTEIFLPAIEWSIGEGGGGDLTDWTQSLAQDYLNRHSVWEAKELKSLFDLPTADAHQNDLEFMLAKNRMIARVLVQANDNDTVLAWLGKLRESFASKSFTWADLVRVAQEVELDIHPYLHDWLSGTALPGYLVSDLTHRRLSDDTEGNPRYESSFYVHNPSDMTGVFWAAYPANNDRDWPRTKTVVVDSKSSIRMNIVTAYEIDYVHIFPNLSLNRDEFGVRRGRAGIWDDNITTEEPRPLYEPADWRPEERGIVVDDLDSGFAAQQPPVQFNTTSMGPLDWFRIPQLKADNDNGLPARAGYAYRTRRGTWGRITDDNAYGHFRRTATVTRYAPEIHEVAFSAEVPDTTRWKLEYFVNTHWFRRSSRDGVYNLEIEHEEATESRDLSFKDSIYGWNFVDEFELLKGDVSVRVVSASNDTPWIYADAIRWVPVRSNRNERFNSGGGGGS